MCRNTVFLFGGIVVFLLVLAASSSQRTPKISSEVASSPLRLRRFPVFDPADLEDVALSAALESCRLVERPSSVSELAHQIRMLQDREDVALQPLVQFLLDPMEFESVFGAGHPVLVRTKNGARFSEILTRSHITVFRLSEAHRGQCLSVLAEIGLSLDTTFTTPTGEVMLFDVMADLIANFSLQEGEELDWITVALALYLPPTSEWSNKFGHTFDFDQLVDVLLSRPFGQGTSCAGTHTLYSMAVLRQANEAHKFLGRKKQRGVDEYLAAAADLLARSQRDDGSWSADWTGERRQDYVRFPERLPAPIPFLEVLVTGHHLEWMSLVPGALRVSKPRLLAAANFVLNSTLDESKSTVTQHICEFSHGVRAIQLLGGGEVENE